MGLVVVGLVMSAGCAKTKGTDAATSSVPPGNPVRDGSLTSSVSPPGGPTTTTAPKAPACVASDAWGFLIVKATDPALRGALTPEQVTAGLATAAEAINQLVPGNANDVAVRTAVAKKLLDGGALTDTDKQNDKDAAARLYGWYTAAGCK